MADNQVILRRIIEDANSDAKGLDSQPFTGKAVGTQFGNQLAMVVALSRILAELEKKVTVLEKQLEDQQKMIYRTFEPGDKVTWTTKRTTKHTVTFSKQEGRVVAQNGEAVIVKTGSRTVSINQDKLRVKGEPTELTEAFKPGAKND